MPEKTPPCRNSARDAQRNEHHEEAVACAVEAADIGRDVGVDQEQDGAEAEGQPGFDSSAPQPQGIRQLCYPIAYGVCLMVIE